MSVAVAPPIIRLYEQQAAFVFDPARYPCFVAGRNSGKTVAGAAKAVTRCFRSELGVIAAPNFPMLERAAKREFLRQLRALADADPRFAHIEQRSARSVFLPATGAEILFGSLDNPDSVRGPNYAWGWLDEGGFVAEDAWKNLKGAVREGDNPQLWTTSTPKGRNWLWSEWVERADANHTLHHVTSYENPFADPDYVDAMGHTGRFYEQEILGSFVAFEGLVYPQFDRQIHVRRTDVDGWRTVLGVDVGTRNPTAILTIHAASDERRHVSRELYRRQMNSDDIATAVAEEARLADAETVYLDPSAAGYIKTLAERGVAVAPANHDLATGIPTVMTALAEGFTIDPACVNTIAEFESYRYPENRRESDKPLPQGNHAMDALRYGLMGLEEGPVLITTDYFGETQRNAWDVGFADDVFHGWS